ncbi:DUF721 domain-containing protein [Nitrosovibrio sp. Nv17]|uniref:DUF721 domain-containing protein n=1 Tax=Nitrosovibrio sp. Nv17 TaxID=1855339 RepID=UPI000908B30E|nr:DUF721 domain-containing protein [Nitrosovibrio sp. Nv17]SFW20032.1 Protein of unknown function [Nitrosovibrio sp. Nv17]
MTTRRIDFYLGAPGISAKQRQLLDHLGTLARMQRAFIEITPPQLAQHCVLGAFSEGSLTLCAHNGAIAAKLRQMVPSLLLKFRSRGHEVTAIRITVQAYFHSPPKSGSPANGSAGKRTIGPGGFESLRRLTAGLPESPLRMAIDSLLERQGKR